MVPTVARTNGQSQAVCANSICLREIREHRCTDYRLANAGKAILFNGSICARKALL
jgi:hypothetical protein